MTRHAAGDGPAAAARSSGPRLRRTVFWKVAGVLVAVQVVTALLAVGLSARFSYTHSRALAVNSLRLRLDQVAEEVEQRGGTAEGDLRSVGPALAVDLTRRLPDPVVLLGADAEVLSVLTPDANDPDARTVPAEVVPPGVDVPALLEEGDIVIQSDGDRPGGTWALVPVYDASGLFVAGGLLVRPLDASLERELAGARRAYVRALAVIVAVAVLLALVLGALVTGRLVRPLRRMTRQVERIGAGDYEARLAARTDDEFGRLAAAINRMAAAVETSIETLRGADQLRRELIANVGHDLRTPLTGLRGYVEEARRHLASGDAPAAEAALATAEQQGAYLQRLVADLFELSLLDVGEAPLRLEPVPVAELLRDAVEAHRAAFRDAGVELVVELVPELPVVRADGVRLLRVVDNLLANARAHTGEAGRVVLRGRAAPGAVLVEVEDTGAGIPADRLDRVFDRYYRGRDARTRRGGGTGLGLAIARAIARAHGGDLTATSEAGRGSCFTLRLPLGA